MTITSTVYEHKALYSCYALLSLTCPWFGAVNQNVNDYQ